MKRFIIAMSVLVLVTLSTVFGAVAFAQKAKGEVPPVEFQFCTGTTMLGDVYTFNELDQAAKDFVVQGCTDVHFKYLGDQKFTGYGTRVTVAN